MLPQAGYGYLTLPFFLMRHGSYLPMRCDLLNNLENHVETFPLISPSSDATSAPFLQFTEFSLSLPDWWRHLNFIQIIAVFLYFCSSFSVVLHMLSLLLELVLLTFCFPLDDKPNYGYHGRAFAELTRRETFGTQCPCSFRLSVSCCFNPRQISS